MKTHVKIKHVEKFESTDFSQISSIDTQTMSEKKEDLNSDDSLNPESFNDKHSESLSLNDTKESMNDSKVESPRISEQEKLSNSSTRFQCSYCDSNYAQKTNLYTHVKQKHEDHFEAWKLTSNLLHVLCKDVHSSFLV